MVCRLKLKGPFNRFTHWCLRVLKMAQGNVTWGWHTSVNVETFKFMWRCQPSKKWMIEFYCPNCIPIWFAVYVMPLVPRCSSELSRPSSLSKMRQCWQFQRIMSSSSGILWDIHPVTYAWSWVFLRRCPRFSHPRQRCPPPCTVSDNVINT